MKTNLSITIVLLLFTLSACEKTSDNIVYVAVKPSLTTSSVSSITFSTATCGGNVTLDGGSTIIARGVCWNTSQYPTTANNKTSDGNGTGTFSSSIAGLTQDSKYYVRAYATNSVGTMYGNEQSFSTAEGVKQITDIDGNVYHSVTIGTQTWMVENLKTTKYRNGEAIPNVTDNTSWAALTTGAYCDYNNTPSNSVTYGKLYNWYAVNDSRNIAPTGWHVPTDAEWTILSTFLGGESVAGSKLKEIGFTAVPGGGRSLGLNDGTFYAIGSTCDWWSSTETTTNSAYSRVIIYNNVNIDRYNYYKHYGISVRCIKDY